MLSLTPWMVALYVVEAPGAGGRRFGACHANTTEPLLWLRPPPGGEHVAAARDQVHGGQVGRRGDRDVRVPGSGLLRGVTVGCHCFKVGGRDYRGDGGSGGPGR